MEQLTLGIVKPDAVGKQHLGSIVRMAEEGGLSVVGLRMLHMSRSQAEGFYHVHQDKPFFGSLTDFMSEGPSVVMALRGENAIGRWREIMGATNPAQAEEGTLRKLFGESIERNAAHGSDSPESACFEIGYFFAVLELS